MWSFRRHRIVLSRSKRGRVASVVFTPSPRAVTAPYVGSFAREAGLWAVAGPRTVEVMRLPGHRRVFRRLVPGAQALAFTPAGDLLAVGSADGTVRIFDVKSNKLVGRFAGHPVELTSLEFSPDGRRLLTTGRDADVRLFSVPSGRLLATLPGHGGLVSDASFSPDGRWIAAAFPTTIGIWAMDDLSTPRLLRGHGPVIRAVVFAPNGYRIFSAGDDGTVRSYDCVVCRPLDQLVPVAERRVAATKPR